MNIEAMHIKLLYMAKSLASVLVGTSIYTEEILKRRSTAAVQKPLGFLGNLLWGIVLLGVGSAIAILFGNLYVFDCLRFEPPTNQGQCELRNHGLLGTDRTSLPITSLQGAYLEESTSRDRDKTYRIVIQTTEGRFPLSDAYTSGLHQKGDLVSKIQIFINTETQERVYVEQDDRWLGYIAGGVFCFVGISLILRAPLDFLLGKV